MQKRESFSNNKPNQNPSIIPENNSSSEEERPKDPKGIFRLTSLMKDEKSKLNLSKKLSRFSKIY